MTNSLHRCANCGIADVNVKTYTMCNGFNADRTKFYYEHIHKHMSEHICLQAALAKLRECRPIVEWYVLLEDKPEHMHKEALALLDSLPGEE